MNTDKNSPICVSLSPHLSVRMAVLGLMIALVVSVPIAGFGIVYVDKNATGGNNGSSWADAYTTIQVGIDDADVSDDEVWVAQGTYCEAIVMKSGVALYGGFNGTETSRSERNWTTNVTTLDGSTVRNGSPAFHVVTMDSITTSTIDGFTITGGNANSSIDSNDKGGGIYCFDLNDTNTISNNKILGNSARYRGGGIYCEQSSPTIMNSTISGNSASRDGGGISCRSRSAPIITDNIISGNSSSRGGGIDCYSSSPRIMRNMISGNSGGGIKYYHSVSVVTNNTILRNSAGQGGGISCFGSSLNIMDNVILQNSSIVGGGIHCSYSSPNIVNNIIADNSANGFSDATSSFGGGIYCYNSDPIIINNTISGNSADGYYEGSGGGICCNYYSSSLIANNTIAGNSASDRYAGSGGGISCYGSVSIINNAIVGNSASKGGGIRCSTGTSAIITNNTIAGNSATKGGGISCCFSSSPMITNTIFSNNDSYDIYEDNTYSDPLLSYNDFYGNAQGIYYDEGTTPYTSVLMMDAAIAECTNNIGLDPLFVGDTLSSGSWTAQVNYNFETFQTTLSDSSASWTSDEHAGRLLNPDTSQNKQFVIVGNTAATITVWGDVTEIAQIGDLYKIFDYHLQPTSPCIDAGGYVSGLSQDFEGDPRPCNATLEPRGDGSDFDIGADEYIGLLWHGFTDSLEGWTTGTAVVFSPPQWVFEPGGLKLISQTNTNTFGFWVSPENAIPVSEGYLYRARFAVSTDVTMPELVPQIRLRVNSSNFQQADCLAIDSSGDGGASPSPDGIAYDLYFVPPTNDDFCMLAFDLLSFNPYDAAHAELALESVLVERFRLDTLDESTTITWTYDFETSQEFWGPGDGTFTFTDPEFFWSDGALHLWSMTNTNTFGYWHSDPIDIIIEEDRLYRGTFEVRTDETDPSRVPHMRLRFNTGNLQASRTLGITSAGDGANSPATTNTTYDRLYFLPPVNCVGKGLIVSFDILNFNPNDAAEASLILDRAIIETLSPPALP